MLLKLLKILFYNKAAEKIAEADKLLRLAEERSKSPVYTTIKSFFRTKEDEFGYYRWLRSTISSDEWKFMLFQLREATIAEMVGVVDSVQLLTLNARLSMLAIIDRFLNTETENYETQFRRTQEDSEGSEV